MDINVGNSTGGAHKADFGPRDWSRWDRTARAIHLAQFQAKPPVLDPFGTKFDAFGVSHNFGRDLTSPVLLSILPQALFFVENDHPWI